VAFKCHLKPRPAPATELAVSPDVIASEHPDGVVFLHVSRGNVFSSNRIGARIWRGLVEHQTLGAITAAIAREYGVEPARVESDAADFLSALDAGGFLTRAARA
jgi:hypothetical protein